MARVVAQFLARVPSLAWDEAAAEQFAIITAELHTDGKHIGMFYTMSAAHALANNAVVITNNTAHCSRISRRTLDNWAQSASGRDLNQLEAAMASHMIARTELVAPFSR